MEASVLPRSCVTREYLVDLLDFLADVCVVHLFEDELFGDIVLVDRALALGEEVAVGGESGEVELHADVFEGAADGCRGVLGGEGRLGVAEGRAAGVFGLLCGGLRPRIFDALHDEVYLGEPLLARVFEGDALDQRLSPGFIPWPEIKSGDLWAESCSGSLRAEASLRALSARPCIGKPSKEGPRESASSNKQWVLSKLKYSG